MRSLLLLTCFISILALAACGSPVPTPSLSTPTRPPLAEPTQGEPTQVAPTSPPMPTASPAATAALITATPEPANAQVAATAEAQNPTAVVALAATEIPAAPVAPASNLVGGCSAILPAPDWKQQRCRARARRGRYGDHDDTARWQGTVAD